jgi:hypothetical protein
LWAINSITRSLRLQCNGCINFAHLNRMLYGLLF